MKIKTRARQRFFFTRINKRLNKETNETRSLYHDKFAFWFHSPDKAEKLFGKSFFPQETRRNAGNN